MPPLHSNIFNHSLNYFGLIIGLSSALFISACSTSSDTVATDNENGDLQLAITDAEEDFLSYQIELDAITLKRIDGATVNILPLSSEIDFVQYQELSELFAVLSVPKGTYSSITLSLDYSDADIVIQDEAGLSYQASAVNALGEALAEVEVELTLNDNEFIHISPRKAAQLTLDLDLAASNTIESFDPAIVTVEPFMIGTTELDENREHRVRGLLETVIEDEQSIRLNIHPMRHKQGKFGAFTFEVNDDTHYEINGIEFTGSAGLNAMTTLTADTPVIAFGQANKETSQNYLAHQVHVGSSVPWAGSDVLKGIITQRSGNDITIEGAVLELEDQAGHFRQTVEMQVSENSTVTGYRLGDADITNLSIGQKVLAFGDFDGDSNTFNAEESNIRIKVNQVVGEVIQTSPLQLALSYINKRPVEVFNFNGTGVSDVEDAKPESYEIATSDLDLSTIEATEWLQVRGYPSAFGSAPLDFEALSIINPDFSSHAAKLHVRWTSDSTNNVNITNEALVLNPETGQSKLHLKGIPSANVLNLSIETVKGNAEQGRYSILTQGSGIDIYVEFSSFVSALNAKLSNSLEVVHLTATGIFSESRHDLEASNITVRLATPIIAIPTIATPTTNTAESELTDTVISQ